MGVAIGGLDHEHSFLYREKGDIEGAASEVEDQNELLLLGLVVEAIRDGGGGRLVDDAEDVETRIGTGFFGSLALSIVEVSGDGDDCRIDRLRNLALGDLLHLGEDHGADLLSEESLLLAFVLYDDRGLAVVAGLDLEGPELDVLLDDAVRKLAADETLSVENGVGYVACGLVLGGFTDEAFLFGEGNKGGRRVEAHVVHDDLDLVILEDAHARVCSSKINAYGDICVSHFVLSIFLIIILRPALFFNGFRGLPEHSNSSVDSDPFVSGDMAVKAGLHGPPCTVVLIVAEPGLATTDDEPYSAST